MPNEADGKCYRYIKIFQLKCRDSLIPTEMDQSSLRMLCLLLLFLLVDAGPDWERYKKTHKKEYESNEEEKWRRWYWKKNRTAISRHNSKQAAHPEKIHYRLKETPLTEYNTTEIQMIAAMTQPPMEELLLRAPSIVPFSTNRPVPNAVDYRNSPCLPPIEYQGICGCCWAFAAVTPIAYQQCVKNDNSVPLSLSKQQLVDCSSNAQYGNKGCNGGWYEKAWRYLIGSSKGLVSGDDYPYQAANGTCQIDQNWTVQADVVSYTPVGQYNETALKVAVALKGPISVAICGTCSSFTNYGSGIYEDPKCNCSVNHGVTVVGYGTSFGVDYWIVRNSWGKTWGLGGYALMRRGINQSNIAFWPSFPTIA